MSTAPAPGILAVDIGGTGLKTAVIDDAGRLLGQHLRVPTPHPCPPNRLLDEVARMAATLGGYDRISIGFPGVVRRQRVLTAVNLGSPAWLGFPLAQALGDRLGHPARMVNDADMQGYGLASGAGLEFVMTLGTGVGTALFRDGQLMPHLELAHHPMEDGKTYEECLGDAALRAEGEECWNRRLSRALELVDILLKPDRIHLGGGNAREVAAGRLPSHVVAELGSGPCLKGAATSPTAVRPGSCPARARPGGGCPNRPGSPAPRRNRRRS